MKELYFLTFIWKSANIEGINVTFAETQVIYDGGNIAHFFNYLCSINSLVGSNLIENATKRSISIMCYVMRTQAFWDGNKRTAMLFANAEMIKNGAGIISVSGNQKTEFGELLTEFYETNNMEKLKTWIYNNAIDGITFES